MGSSADARLRESFEDCRDAEWEFPDTEGTETGVIEDEKQLMRRLLLILDLAGGFVAPASTEILRPAKNAGLRMTVSSDSYCSTTGLIPTGTTCPEIVIGLLAVVMSWYSVHCDATVWFPVVQEPLAQVCAVSHMIR